MTYSAREQSVAAGAPIEFFRWSRGSGETAETWLHVASDRNRTFNGELYTATPALQRSNLEQSGEAGTMQSEVTLPGDVVIAAEFRGSQSPAPVLLTIYRTHEGLDDAEAKPIYTGEVSSAEFEASTLKLTHMRTEARWGEGLVRIHCERTCPFMLFGTLCGADPDAVTFSARIATISEDLTVLTVEEQDAPPGSTHLDAGSGYYARGSATRFGHRAFVTKQDGDELTLQTPVKDAAEGDIITLTAGCNRRSDDCEDVHNNLDRFGGFELIPDRSPWKGVR